MNKGWENSYVGIPYKYSGRDKEGLDCWGLVRLVYKEQFNIDLPSFTDVDTLEKQAETIAKAQEGWNKVDIEKAGDVVVFNIMGQPTHVGMIVRPGYFIHSFENQDVRIERLDSPKWNKRLFGIFRYNDETTSASLIGLAHPLSTKKIEIDVEAGKSLTEIHEKIKSDNGISSAYCSDAVIYVDSEFIPKEEWNNYIVSHGQRIEYRAVMQGGGGGHPLRGLDPLDAAINKLAGPKVTRIAATIAIAYASAMTGGAVGAATGSTFLGAVAGVAVTAVGTALVNRQFPIRPPTLDNPTTNANEQGVPSWFLQGSRNQENKYGAIPVILGTMRYTPPLAASSYYESEDTNSFLKNILCWGYGPLEVSSITIGENPISNYSEVTMVTLEGTEGEDRTAFDAVYSKDVKQLQVGIVLDNTITEVVRTLNETVTQINVTFDFPQGLYSVDASSGSKSGATASVKVYYRLVGASTWTEHGTVSVSKKALSAFAKTETINVPEGIYEIKVDTWSTPTGEYDAKTLTLAAITGYANRQPVAFPKALAMSAVRIKSTNQLNGQVEGFVGTVSSKCKDWDTGTGAWVVRKTSNPASLYRYVLQHPANARAVADSKIDLLSLQEWHEFCQENNFTYNAVLTSQQSLFEVLKDIAAAGRGSPTRYDGKWSVVVDKPRDSITQHFTPHNSWGFAGSKLLPKIPHAFRVSFINEDKGYQPDERIVYDDGYNESNATLFEGLNLPGVTDPDIVYKHARFHLAQLKLRPESYVLNADIEHLVCNRGDLVRVTHDVPMWGLGSGRIKEKVSSTELVLDEPVPFEAGKQYSIRIRNQDGSSTVKTVASKTTSAEYTEIVLTTALDSDEGNALDLFLFGEMNAESVDLIVTKVEPSNNMTARLTLEDYSPAVYDSDTEAIPAFNSKITSPASFLKYAITSKPTVTSVQANESALVEISPGKYGYGLRINWSNPTDLPEDVSHVEIQVDWYGDNTSDWLVSQREEYTKGSTIFSQVDKGESYVLRLRYIDRVGRTGPWTDEQQVTVTGRTRPPSDVAVFTALEEFGSLRLDWSNPSEIDVSRHEIRLQNSNWGVADQYRVFFGDGTKTYYSPTTSGNVTFYIKSISDDGLYAENATSATYSYSNIPNPSTLEYSFHDTSVTTATITFDWDDVSTVFGTKGYEISYDSTTKFVNASTIVLPANWIGDKTFTVKTVDNLGAKSSGKSIVVTKLAPNPPTDVRTQVIDNNVMLYWINAEKTTLPIAYVRIRKGSTFADSVEVGTKAGAFTTISELVGGNYTYWLTSVDTDGNESIETKVTASVSEPPDFVFRGELLSDMNSGGGYWEDSRIWDDGFIWKDSASLVLTNAELTENGIILPVNTTETFQEHFTNNSWTTPNAQVVAGYPVFIQPANLTATVQEVFDFGTTLNSSKVTVTQSGSIISGSPSVSVDIEVSPNNSTWKSHYGVTSVFENNFRYVRVTIKVTGDDRALYLVEQMVVRCDAKQKTDSFSGQCLSSDTSGTVFNFTKEMLDVESIVLTAQSTTPVMVVYDFKDSIISGTFSISSNVCTVNATSHGLIAGQKVRLSFLTDTATNQVATVATASTNSFTCSITNADTSGDVDLYWQGIRAYCFDNTGTRVTKTISANIRGY